MEVTKKILQLTSDYISSEQSNDLIEHLFAAGAHYGHTTRAWNPLMRDYIHETHNKSHIINLKQTVKGLIKSLEFLYTSALTDAKILFVCTDPQMSEIVATEASRCDQHYVTRRWRGGLLTNWNTTEKSIAHKFELENILNKHSDDLKKKEKLSMQREIDKIFRSLGGVEKMEGLPDVVVISNLVRERVAVEEVRRLQKLGVPIKSIGIVDTNANPQSVDYAIPSNDDSVRVLEFYLKLMSNVIIEGLSDSQAVKNLNKTA